ncbi:MAG: nitronate monooxygenase [Lentisphaerae bacterium]|nr:nitronate monooxygenase [Lentisphaerota bacterium]
MSNPVIIQGGMGVGVSHWGLARAVSMAGQLGVVSGTGLDVILARRLQSGDPGGHMRRAIDHFPFPAVAARVWERYFVEGGIGAGQTYRGVPMHALRTAKAVVELTALANFVEVYLAREGHAGPVGINYLEKIQLPTLPSVLGAMLAGVDYVLMGAGIPMAIPGALDRFAAWQSAGIPITVAGAQPGETYLSTLDPAEMDPAPRTLKRPQFLAIISSATLAIAMSRKASGRVDGFVVEGASAGGHNAPPRGPLQLTDRGEPRYGPRDLPDLEKIRELGLPFWLAGSFADPEKLAEARQAGAAGVQVGTAFAFCEESGLEADLKRRVLDAGRQGRLDVFTDPRASPTGFPLKVLALPGTLSEPDVYARRPRLCDLGYLRHAYRLPDGTLGYRCPSEPESAYVRKGGDPADMPGRKCVCNGLVATVGLPQIRPDGYQEAPLITAGDDVARIDRFLKPGATSYHAADVIQYLLGPAS